MLASSQHNLVCHRLDIKVYQFIDVHIFLHFCSKVDKIVTIKGKECLNVASLNFLCMTTQPKIEVRLTINVWFLVCHESTAKAF